jgi:pilus assembly protein Flp/PilA
MNRLARLLFAAPALLSRFRGQERGATATEYSLLAGFIALVIVSGVGLFGMGLNTLFGSLTMGVKTALGIP